MLDICKVCNGHCCVGFTLTTIRQDTNERVELTKKDTEYVHERVGDFMEFIADDEDESWWKCNRFDSDTKLCSMYDERPDLCKSYHCSDYDSIMYLILTDEHEVIGE